MRKVTREVCGAFMNRRALRLSNTETDGTSLWLFGNKIAEWRNGHLCITNCGWQSRTTQERLNGLDGVHITQRNFVWYLNGTEWDGRWIQVGGESVLEDTTPIAQLLDIPTGAVAGSDDAVGTDELLELLRRFEAEGVEVYVQYSNGTNYAIAQESDMGRAKQIVSEHFCSIDTEYLFSC